MRLVADQDRGWWMDDPGLPEVFGSLVSFEDYATYERGWANSLISGLLQTRAHALALHQEARIRKEPDAITAEEDNRMRRQEILQRGPSYLRVVLRTPRR
ncbi:DUF5753 domain-containing protein [Streptomyces sp. LP05-1]|uniref:DUF5753 domain-containing protein n=1 Tax=Streptomyces pyxinae TaxID=2970734 RepID=A0ABT2CNW7_9ACTN|nr:DUF5753 domain-containing protein [Streptomyces sp. LP05-1]MCS0639000.1 DUF5753 domain-containing protein [Streptomyces sp. LP05-1]